MYSHIRRQTLDYTHGLTLFVFGDLQWTQKSRDGKPRGFDEDAWSQFKDELLMTKNAVALGLGDYGDWLRPSMRSRVQASMGGDDSARQQMDDAVRRVQDDLIREMDFLEGKLIGLHSGHHNWEFLSGGCADQRLATALKAPFLGWSATTRLVLTKFRRKQNDKSGGYVYTIASQHGNSNARRVGPSATWMENNMVAGLDADQYVMGHGCKSASWYPNERLRVRRIGPAGVDRQLPRCLIVGGFSRSFTDGWESSYAERAGYSPQPVSWGVIRFKLVQRKTNAELAGLHGAKRANGEGYRYKESLDIEQLNRTPVDATQAANA